MPKKLTKAQAEVLAMIQERGFAFGGSNAFNGRTVKVNARTLEALERRGLIDVSFGPDGAPIARKIG